MDFCTNHEYTYWRNFTDCAKISRYINRHIKDVEELKWLVRKLTRVEDKNHLRLKRRSFNFIEEISKILFGTMDSDDASYCAEKLYA